MSATLPNVADIGRWWDAHVFEATERPIPLREFIQVCDVVDHVARPSALAQPPRQYAVRY